MKLFGSLGFEITGSKPICCFVLFALFFFSYFVSLFVIRNNSFVFANKDSDWDLPIQPDVQLSRMLNSITSSLVCGTTPDIILTDDTKVKFRNLVCNNKFKPFEQMGVCSSGDMQNNLPSLFLVTNIKYKHRHITYKRPKTSLKKFTTCSFPKIFSNRLHPEFLTTCNIIQLDQQLHLFLFYSTSH